MAKVLVTGANRGIGLELVRQYAGRGDEVIAVCRQSSAALSALPVRCIEDVDVSSDASVQTLADALSGQRIDVLINNAGLLIPDRLGSLDMEAIERQFAVNAFGPLRVTSALLANLQQGSKVAIVTSRMGSIADNTSGGYYGYRASKAAVNMVGRSLSLDLRDRGISVVLLHPGFVRTGMTGNNGHMDPDASATGLIARIDEQTLEMSGRFVHMSGEVLTW